MIRSKAVYRLRLTDLAQRRTRGLRVSFASPYLFISVEDWKGGRLVERLTLRAGEPESVI